MKKVTIGKCTLYHGACEDILPTLETESVDLIVTDVPFAINGDKLHKHYNRKEEFVIDGYVEYDINEYFDFCRKWIKEAERVLKVGGSIYIVSGWTNLIDILNALKQTKLIERNHIIWKYNFGVYTKNKYVSSHYHILYYTKGNKNITFNTECRFNKNDRHNKRSLLYADMEDVFIIAREYKRGQIKNKNQLPEALLKKLIQYSSNEGDTVLDMFAGSFSTIKVAKELKRKGIGIEKNKKAFDYFIQGLKK